MSRKGPELHSTGGFWLLVGALLLAGLYALFNEQVMPTLTRRIQEMFNYAG